jgi:hypothetical protein
MLALAALAVQLGGSPQMPPRMIDRKLAEDAARAWLTLVDTGRLAESWDEAGAQLQQAVPRGGWPRAVSRMRPVERPLTRRSVRTEMRSSLPGEREGEYVILRYRTTFAGVAGYQVYSLD